jgi:hypothetical protein
MPTPDLGLPDSPHWDVYLCVENQLRAQCGWVKLFRGDSSTLPADWAGWTAAECPGMRLTASIREEGMRDQAAHGSMLDIFVEVALAGLSKRNHFKAWRAIKRALYQPVTADLQAFQERLRTAGAYPPLVLFRGYEISTEDLDSGVLIGNAGVSIGVRESVYP